MMPSQPQTGKKHYTTAEEEEFQIELIVELLLNPQHRQGLTTAEIVSYIFDRQKQDQDYLDFVDSRNKGTFNKAVARLLDKMEKLFLVCRDRITLRYTVDLRHPPFNLLSVLRSQLGQRLMPRGLYQAMDETSHRIAVHAESAEEDADEAEDAARDALTAKKSRMQRRLQRFQETYFGRWTRKFRRINHNSFGFHQYLLVKDKIYPILSDALLHETKVKLTYQTKSSENDQVIHFSPLGLVVFGPSVYLVGKYGGENISDVRRLLVSRIADIEATSYPISEKCKNFDLDAYVDGGYFDFSDHAYDLVHPKNNQKPAWQAVTIRCVSDSTFDRMKEVFSQLVKTELAVCTLTFNAHVSPELEKFLQAEGPLLEVLAPEDLRQRMAANLKAAAALYQE